MAKFPAWGVGLDVSGTNLANDVPNIVTKTATSTYTSNATLANDAELAAIALEIGTWEIETEYWVSGNGTSATGGFRELWTFSGTVTGTPTKSVQGPTPGNTVAATGFVSQLFYVANWNTTILYGLLTGSAHVIKQTCPNFVVATAGNLTIQFAQAVSNATSTVVQPGSRVKCRRIA